MARAVAEAAVQSEPTDTARPWKAYELTDAHGGRALVWWNAERVFVEADDSAFGRRVKRALRRPIHVREDRLDAEGWRSSYQVVLQPTDAEYATRLHWNWHQIGLGDVAVEVVELREPTPEERTALAELKDRLRNA